MAEARECESGQSLLPPGSAHVSLAFGTLNFYSEKAKGDGAEPRLGPDLKTFKNSSGFSIIIK